MRYNQEKLSHCIHESGHAVMAIHNGDYFHSICVLSLKNKESILSEKNGTFCCGYINGWSGRYYPYKYIKKTNKFNLKNRTNLNNKKEIKELEKDCAVLYAGSTAELVLKKYYSIDMKEDSMEDGFEEDEKQMKDRIRYTRTENETKKTRDAGFKLAEKVMVANKEKLFEIAKKLYKKKKLYYNEIFKMLMN